MIKIRILMPNGIKTLEYTDYAKAWSIFTHAGSIHPIEWIDERKLDKAYSRSEFSWRTFEIDEENEAKFAAFIAGRRSVFIGDTH